MGQAVTVEVTDAMAKAADGLMVNEAVLEAAMSVCAKRCLELTDVQLDDPKCVLESRAPVPVPPTRL